MHIIPKGRQFAWTINPNMFVMRPKFKKIICLSFTYPAFLSWDGMRILLYYILLSVYRNRHHVSYRFKFLLFAYITFFFANKYFKLLLIFPTMHYKRCLFKYTENFTPKKNDNFQIKNSDIFHISAQNIDCGYSLELLRWGGSNEYPWSMFWEKIRKITSTLVNPSSTI